MMIYVYMYMYIYQIKEHKMVVHWRFQIPKIDRTMANLVFLNDIFKEKVSLCIVLYRTDKIKTV